MDPVVKLAQVPQRPPRVDYGIAGLLLVWALLEALFAAGPGPGWARVLTAIAFTAPLALRRRAPVQVLVFILVVLVVRGLTTSEPEAGAMPFPAVLVAAFSAALYAQPAALAIAATLGGPATIYAAAELGYYSGGDPTAVDLAILTFISLGAWTGGWLVRRRAAQLEQARAAAPELAREAVAAERARVARELHDVVAHSVSIIAVQAGAAEMLVADDPQAARTHMESVRRTAHEALGELRRLVGVLRDDEAVLDPQPGLGRLGELLDEARSTGLPVELTTEGEPRNVPPGLDLAAYRIVQEGLTNVRRHAGPVPTQVRVRYEPAVLEVEVENAPGRRNGGSGEGTGHGLIGMRERARLYGGSLEVGEQPGGGFRVRARLPLEVEA